MPPGLRHVIEFVAVEIEAANQGANGAIARVDRNKGGFHFRQLADLPGALVVFLQADDGAAFQALVGGRLVVEHPGGELHCIAGEGDDLATLAVSLDLPGVGSENQGGDQIAGIGDILQCFVDGLVLIRLDVLHVEIGLGAAIAMPPVVVHDAFAQAVVSGFLLRLDQRGVHLHSA